MVLLSNHKTKDYLEIVIEKDSSRHIISFKKQHLLNCDIKIEVEKARMEIRTLFPKLGKRDLIVAVNHVIGSMQDYFKFITYENGNQL